MNDYKYCKNCDKEVEYDRQEAVQLGSPETSWVNVCIECDEIIEEEQE